MSRFKFKLNWRAVALILVGLNIGFFTGAYMGVRWGSKLATGEQIEIKINKVKSKGEGNSIEVPITNDQTQDNTKEGKKKFRLFRRK